MWTMVHSCSAVRAWTYWSSVRDEWGEEFRGDPQLIKLFKEKGAKWIGGSLRSQIVPVAYPAGFEDFVRISEYDGLEKLRVDFSRAFEKGVKDLMAQEDATMEDVRALDSKIAKTRDLYWTLVQSPPSRRGYA